MKFVVYSRSVMQNATPPDKPWALISICEEGVFPTVHENEHLMGRLNLKFHDVDDYKNGVPENDDRILFNDAFAKQVVDFVEDMQSKDVTVIYVHCLMGRCRSAGIGAALDKALNGDDAKYFGRGPYQPNMRVYRCVLNACHEKDWI